jgi:hypothetical protein
MVLPEPIFLNGIEQTLPEFQTEGIIFHVRKPGTIKHSIAATVIFAVQTA